MVMVVSGMSISNGERQVVMSAEERQALLTRIAVELTFLVPATDDSFNTILEQLRKSLSRDKDGAALKDHASAFFQHLVGGGLVRAEAASADVADSARQLVAALDAGFPQIDAFFELKQQLEAASSLADVASSVRQLIPLIGAIGAERSDTSMTEPVVAPMADQQRKRTSWRSRLVGRSAQQTAGEIFALVRDDLGPVLGKVLEQIQALDMTPERSQRVKAQMNDAQSLHDLQLVLESTLQLVVEITSEIDGERGKTENFLGEIRLRLKDLEGDIVSAVNAEASINNADQIQAEVGTQVSGIEDAVAQGANLDLLKQVVAKRIEVLNRSFTDYIDNQRQRVDVARGKIAELTGQLRSMDAQIENLRHEVNEKQLAINMDALTGVANRGGFDKRVADEFAHSRRIKYPLSLLFVDLDEFKAVNDTFGHIAGDTVLRAVAGAMKSRIRETDYIARYGGDEFVVLLPNTQALEAKNLAEALMRNVRRTGFHDGGKPVEITLSIGVAEVKSDDTIQTALQRADGALRLVKGAGRNAVEVAA